jgi:hypothetical protein
MTSLIAHAALFGNPVPTQARLSPDGCYILCAGQALRARRSIEAA